jgi:hypothetical protein
MTMPMVPYEGRMSYCLVKSLQMVLAYQGHTYPLPWLECVSGVAFEFVYVPNPNQFFAIIGDYYHLGGERLLRNLNFSYTYTGYPDDKAALVALAAALKAGPVVAGMLDMGYLTYAPYHQALLGSDHAIVILALTGDSVIVHDPDGYCATPLPLGDFVEAWQRDIYTGKPYGLWQIGPQAKPPSEPEIWERTLAHARESLAHAPKTAFDGAPIIYGPEGMRTMARDLREQPERSLGGLAHFNWRVSGQRCLDSAFFLSEKLPQAASIRWEECQLYGQLQTATATNNRAALPDILECLAECEIQFIKALA